MMDFNKVTEAVEERLAVMLAQPTDNPMFEEHYSRAIMNYISCLKTIKDIQKKEEGGFSVR